MLVTLVGSDVGGSDTVGIYRVDGPDRVTPIADIGAFSLNHPPSTPFEIPTGVRYALETYRGGFLVTDGHHNRVLRVTLDGEVTERIAFDNVVGPAGSPARPNTGSVVKVNRNGTFTVVADGLDRPTSLEFIRGTAHVVTLGGEIWRLDGVSCPPHGASH